MLDLNTIKAEMARNNIAGVELAKILKLSKTSLYLKLNGKRQFTAYELGVLSVALNKEVNFFYK